VEDVGELTFTVVSEELISEDLEGFCPAFLSTRALYLAERVFIEGVAVHCVNMALSEGDVDLHLFPLIAAVLLGARGLGDGFELPLPIAVVDEPAGTAGSHSLTLARVLSMHRHDGLLSGSGCAHIIGS